MEHPDTDWGGRLPLLGPDALDPAQRDHDRRLRETGVPWAERSGFMARSRDDRLIGPFNAFLHSPEIARGFGRYTAAETEHTGLSPTLREVVILTVGSIWQADYEIYAHVAVARSIGLREEVVDTIRAGEDPGGVMTDEEAAVYRFTRELVGMRRVGARTYGRAVELLGTRTVVDLVHLAGQYMTVSALLNAFTVPAPEIPPAP